MDVNATAIVAVVIAVLAIVQATVTERRRAELEHRYSRLERLETETGPLRLYMYLCARATVRWVTTYSKDWWDEHPWPVRALPSSHDEAGYHTAGPMIYRLLRPLTVSSLIVHRMHDADLALDEPMVEIVRFHNAAYDMLTREEIVEPFNGHEGYCFDSAWTAVDPAAGPRPFQRIRDSYLRSAADALSIAIDGDRGRRCMSHTEFLDRWEHPRERKNAEFHEGLEPVTSVIDKFDPQANPLFWFRLVGYAYACTSYLKDIADYAKHQGITYTVRDLEIKKLLDIANDRAFDQPTEYFEDHFDSIISEAL